MSKLKFFILIFLCLFFATCLKDNPDTTVSLYDLVRKYVGKKGLLIFFASSTNEFEEDMTRSTHFQAKISDTKNVANIFNVKCGFWKLSEESLYVFCDIGTDIPAGKYSIDFSEIQAFKYQNYNVRISNKKFDFEKLDIDVIELYSKNQIINIKEDQDSYEVKFNILQYYQEALVLDTLGLIFMSCKQNNNELICQLKKDDLLRDIKFSDTNLDVHYIDYREDRGISRLPLVGRINIIYNIVQKTDVFVGITRLLENVAEGESTFTFETNVTNIKKVLTKYDYLHLDIYNEKNQIERTSCSFRKYGDDPLLIVCIARKSIISDFWLKELKEEIIVDRANIRYNFRVQPFKYEEKIYYSNKENGTFIVHILPEILDFTNKQNLYIYYTADRVSYLKGITFNKDKGYLSCEIVQSYLLRCNVPKTQFEKNGYYITKHTNHLNRISAFYESRPIKVVLKGHFYSISLYYLLLLILIMF